MNTSPLSSATGSAKYADVPLDRLAANPKVPQGEKLAAACKAFEAVLLRQILESAQKQVVTSNLTPSSASSSIYRDLISSQMADQIAATGQFGLARSFLDQIKGRQPRTEPATPAPATVGGRDLGPAIPEPTGFTAATAPATPPHAGATKNNAPAGTPPESPSSTSPLASRPKLKPFLSGPDLKAYRHE
jgi:Rod binding domain-containing protein